MQKYLNILFILYFDFDLSREAFFDNSISLPFFSSIRFLRIKIFLVRRSILRIFDSMQKKNRHACKILARVPAIKRIWERIDFLLRNDIIYKS